MIINDQRAFFLAKNSEKTTPLRPQLGAEIEAMLEDFCAAHHGANASEVVRKAVRDFIMRDIATNEGAKRAYDAAQAARQRD